MRTPVFDLLSLLAVLPVLATGESTYNSAVALYSQHKPLEAQRAFEGLASAEPENSAVQFYLGRLALQLNDPVKAVTHLEKAASLSPDDGRIHLKLGDAYGLSAQKAGFFSKLGWAEKCRQEYEKSVELDPKNLDARWSLMEFCRQAPAIAGGGVDKALAQAREIKKIDPARGRLALATIHTATKKYDLAFGEFEEVLATEPDNYEALFQIGRLAALTGERGDQGLAALKECLKQTPAVGQAPLSAVHWRMGNILEKKGDKPGARSVYEAAVKLDPQFSPAIDALGRL